MNAKRLFLERHLRLQIFGVHHAMDRNVDRRIVVLILLLKARVLNNARVHPLQLGRVLFGDAFERDSLAPVGRRQLHLFHVVTQLDQR